MFNAWIWSLKEPIRNQDTKRNNQSTSETHTSFDMSRKSKSEDQTKALNIPFTLTLWLANRPEMTTSDWSHFLAVDWLTMEHISILLPPDYILK
jgi:hypothetical protein